MSKMHNDFLSSEHAVPLPTYKKQSNCRGLYSQRNWEYLTPLSPFCMSIMPTHLLLTFIKNIEDCCSQLFLTYWQKCVVNLKVENVMMNLMLIGCHMIEFVLFFFFLALHISLYSDTEIMHKMKYEHSKWGKNRIQIARIILINFLWVYRYVFEQNIKDCLTFFYHLPVFHTLLFLPFLLPMPLLSNSLLPPYSFFPIFSLGYDIFDRVNKNQPIRYLSHQQNTPERWTWANSLFSVTQ